jgi:hypothetical protein
MVRSPRQAFLSLPEMEVESARMSLADIKKTQFGEETS